MTKPFLSYQQQIQKLTDEKHLIINNPALAEEKLRDIELMLELGKEIAQ